MSLPHLKSAWMLVAGFFFGIMGVFVKLGSQHFSSAELVFYRSLIGLIAIFAIVKHQKLTVATSKWKNHLWRGLSGFASLMTFFYSISLLPLPAAVTLNYTSPLFLALLTAILLNERVHWPLVAAIVIGFVGVGLLLRPTFQQEQLTGGLLGLTSGFLAAIAYFNVKQLGRLGEPESRVVFYFTLISTIGAGLWMLAHTFNSITPHGLMLLLGLGISATLAQLAMTRAYHEGKTLVVGSLAYSTVVFASLLGILVWDDILPASSWLAIALIILSGLVSVRVAPRAPATAE